jgi:hypothetical protein
MQIEVNENKVNNFKVLQERYSFLAEKIESQKANDLKWCRTRKGQKNLCEERDGKAYYYHSNYDLIKETEKWKSSLSLEDSKLFYIFGLGLGYSYIAMKEWLDEKPGRYLIYFEEDIRVIERFLEMDHAKELLEDDRILLCGLKMECENDQETLEALAYYYIQLRFSVTALPFYAVQQKERFDQIQVGIMHKSAFVGFVSGEFLNFGVAFYRNFYQNMLKGLPGAHLSSGLVNQFKNVPAIICGAGPSLNKNFDLLKNLSNRALLFAGGSSVKALANRGLLPHFGGTVDPNLEQYKRMTSQTAYELPFFFKGRVHHPALSHLHGPKVYLAGNMGYPVTTWMERELGIGEEPLFTEGNNILHLSIDIARNLGCNPIIFVGMDLAYTDMQQYASDVLVDNQLKEEDLTAATHLNNNSFLRDDIHGDPVYTLWKWVAESNYTSNYAKQHPDVTFINATEGGIGMKDIPNLTLEEVAEKYLQTDRNLYAQVHQLLQTRCQKTIQKPDVVEVINKLKGSLKECIELCDKLDERFTEFKEAILSNVGRAIEAVSKRIEEEEKKLSEELAYQQILSPVNHIRSVLYERQFSEAERDLADDEQKKILMHCDQHQEELKSIKRAAEVNLEVIRDALKDECLP